MNEINEFLFSFFESIADNNSDVRSLLVSLGGSDICDKNVSVDWSTESRGMTATSQGSSFLVVQTMKGEECLINRKKLYD